MNVYQTIDAASDRRRKHVASRFQEDVASHQLHVLHDNGVYRHLRFQRPTTRTYFFDLVTWPWHLAITGDMGAHVFCRLEDMFEFFRDPNNYGDGINPQYWAEKVISGKDDVKRYDQDIFQAVILAEAAEHESQFPGLVKVVNNEIFHEWRGVEWSCEEIALQAMSTFEFPPLPRNPDVPVFQFEATADYDFRDWTYHYLWCCHAIRWGVAQYDRRKQVEASDGA